METKADNLEFGVRQNCKEIETLDKELKVTQEKVKRMEKDIDGVRDQYGECLEDHGKRLSRLESPKPQEDKREIIRRAKEKVFDFFLEEIAAEKESE